MSAHHNITYIGCRYSLSLQVVVDGCGIVGQYGCHAGIQSLKILEQLLFAVYYAKPFILYTYQRREIARVVRGYFIREMASIILEYVKTT